MRLKQPLYEQNESKVLFGRLVKCLPKIAEKWGIRDQIPKKKKNIPLDSPPPLCSLVPETDYSLSLNVHLL